MLKKITLFFETHMTKQVENIDPQHALNLSIAALLIEMTQIDNQIDSMENSQLQNILIEQYGLSKEEIDELTKLANEELKTATDYYQFTSLINSHFEQAEKILMIEALWKIAIADGKIDSYEEHYLRKISDLLFVPHSEYIKAKIKILKI